MVKHRMICNNLLFPGVKFFCVVSLYTLEARLGAVPGYSREALLPGQCTRITLFSVRSHLEACHCCSSSMDISNSNAWCRWVWAYCEVLPWEQFLPILHTASFNINQFWENNLVSSSYVEFALWACSPAEPELLPQA